MPPVSEARDPFRIRDHVAEFDTVVAEIRERSEATRRNVPMVGNIAYGTGPSETLDLFFPAERTERMPVHLFIHGGYWRMFSKDDYSYVADTVTRAGSICAVVDYALMPSVRMEVLVDQVRRAKRWLIDGIAGYGGDPTHLTVSGHSAGAHLATFLFSGPETPSGVRAALLLGGLYDLEPLQRSFLEKEIALTDEEVRHFSPLGQTHDSGTRVAILVGADETPPFHQQASAFNALLARQGLDVSNNALSGTNHMTSVRDLGRPETDAGRALADLIANA